MQTTTDNVLSKIRKLLKLAGDKGATPAEAALAAERAAGMMLRHGIEEAAVQTDAVRAASIIGEYSGKSYEAWQRVLARAAAKLVGCTTVVRKVGSRSGWSLAFVGRPTNIEAAAVLFDFFLEQARHLCREFVRDQGGRCYISATDRRAFVNGLVHTVNERVDQHLQELAQSDAAANYVGSTALVVKDHLALLTAEAATVLNSPRFTKKRASKSTVSAAGLEAGERVVLTHNARVQR